MNQISIWNETERLISIHEAAQFANVSPWAVLNVTIAEIAQLVGRVDVGRGLSVAPEVGVPTALVGDAVTCGIVLRAATGVMPVATSPMALLEPSDKQSRSARDHAAEFEYSVPVFALEPERADIWKKEERFARRTLWARAQEGIAAVEPLEPVRWRWAPPTEFFEFQRELGSRVHSVYYSKPSVYFQRVMVATALASLDDRPVVTERDWELARLVQDRSDSVRATFLPNESTSAVAA